MKYLVTIQKTMDYTIEISAKDEESAAEKALDLFETKIDKFEISDEDHEILEIEES